MIKVDLHQNGKSTGWISETDFKAVQKAVYRSWRVAMAQMMNCINAGMKILLMLACLIPLVCFWIVTALLMDSPQNLDLTGVDIAGAAKFLLLISSITSGTMLFVVASFFGMKMLGFKDLYQEEIQHRVRQRVMLDVLSRGSQASRKK